MSSKIIPTTEYVNSLEKKYKDLEIPIYKLRKWFPTNPKVFFNCEESDKSSSLRKKLAKKNFSTFNLHLVVKDATILWR